MPSFAPRLSEICDSINRKLGGPVIIAPPKPRAKPLSSKSDAKPGAVAKRTAKPASKNIEKALFKERSRRSVSRGPSNAIALLRSASSANIPGFKREPSDLDRKSPVERMGLLSTNNSLTALEDAKAQKKALVDAELKDAITALRKPNRELAGKAIVEAAEKRTSGGLSSIKSVFLPGLNSHIANAVCSRIEETNTAPFVRRCAGEGDTGQPPFSGCIGVRVKGLQEHVHSNVEYATFQRIEGTFDWTATRVHRYLGQHSFGRSGHAYQMERAA